MAEERIDNMEIEPLSDEDLEGVAGGSVPAETSGGPSCCSCSQCSNGD